MNRYDPINTGSAIFRYKTSTKEKAFIAIVVALAKWWQDGNPGRPFEENDLGRLKISKLLFFVVAANTELLGVFNRWVARPLGHEEDDIADLIRYRKGDFGIFQITQERLILKKNDNERI